MEWTKCFVTDQIPIQFYFNSHGSSASYYKMLTSRFAGWHGPHAHCGSATRTTTSISQVHLGSSDFIQISILSPNVGSTDGHESLWNNKKRKPTKFNQQNERIFGWGKYRDVVLTKVVTIMKRRQANLSFFSVHIISTQSGPQWTRQETYAWLLRMHN